MHIDHRFRGPPQSGNGGYVAGLVAAPIGGSGCMVTLKLPPPLATGMELARDGDAIRLIDDEALVALAEPAEIAIDVPPPPALPIAEEASRRFAGFDEHVFPGCFVCGPERAEGDGLRIFPGPVGDAAGQVAALWVATADLADEGGHVRPEFLWAALDCPGYFAVQPRSGPAVLGRIGVMIHGRPRAGEPLLVTGWPIASEGRKHQAGTAIHDRDGRLIAAALATWISIRA